MADPIPQTTVWFLPCGLAAAYFALMALTGQPVLMTLTAGIGLLLGHVLGRRA